MPITSLQDALKTLAQSLQLSNILPATMFVLVNLIFVLPRFLPEADLELSNLTVIIVITSITIILSYLLYAFNHTLIRIFEGYEGPFGVFMQAARYEQLVKFNQLRTEIETSGLTTVQGMDALQKLDNHFPSREGYVLPTTFGNVIAAFEDYPRTRYGMDAVALWPRLMPVLQEKKYLDYVAQQKAVVDFLVNISVVVLICGIELTYLLIYLNYLLFAIICGFATFGLFRLLYIGAIGGALQWGYSVRAAFDLYRWDLWKMLHLLPVSKYREEFIRWQEVSDLVVQAGERPRDFEIFSYKETQSDASGGNNQKSASRKPREKS